LAAEFITQMRGVCKGGDVDLSRYPNLCHSSEKGVFTHLAGRPVKDIAQSVKELEPGGAWNLIAVLEGYAKKDGVTLDELLDAIRFARANKMI
jgi:hypothetical protein